jgi:hypothetical protein
MMADYSTETGSTMANYFSQTAEQLTEQDLRKYGVLEGAAGVS